MFAPRCLAHRGFPQSGRVTRRGRKNGGALEILTLPDGSRRPARHAQRLPAGLPIRSSRDVKLGASVFTMGFPNPDIQGFNPKLTKGDISGLTGIQDDPRLFQISAPIQPGNSGGPLVDSAGNVVAVIVSKLDDATTARLTGSLPQSVNYAIKSHYVLGILDAVPGLSTRLKKPQVAEASFDLIVQSVQAATVQVLVY